MDTSRRPRVARRIGAGWRIGCLVVAILVVQTITLGLAAVPAVLLWQVVLPLAPSHALGQAVVIGVAVMPSYGLFAFCLLGSSALMARLTAARTPENVELGIADMSWRLMQWARYGAGNHVVRVLAGTFFRGTPVWSWYLWLNGARIGRRVYVNSLHLNDYNLLEFDDDVVIGAEVHLSGHTVEHGVLKTGRIRVGRGATIGLGSAIDIDVEIGAGCQIAAMSLVPKHSRLKAGGRYAGVPVRPLEEFVARRG